MKSEKLPSVIPDMEKALIELTLGTKKPENDSERRLKKEIDEIVKAGGIVEIPSEW